VFFLFIIYCIAREKDSIKKLENNENNQKKTKLTRKK